MESLCGRGGAEILVCFSVFLKQPLGCFFQSDPSCTRTLFLFFFVENDIIETDERNEKGGIPLANKETIQEIVLVIIGNLVLALGVTVFILPNDVLTGGLTGIAVAPAPVRPRLRGAVRDRGGPGGGGPCGNHAGVTCDDGRTVLCRMAVSGKAVCAEDAGLHHLLSAVSIPARMGRGYAVS